MKCGFAEKDIIEKWANGEEIPKPPQPKSPPPQPPSNFDDENQVNTFKTAYEKSEYHTNGSKWNVITLNDMTIESKHKWKSITKTMTINRTNGNLRTTLQHDVDPVPTTGKGECKKHKKKF